MEHAVNTPPPKLEHPVVTFYLTNNTTTTLLHFSYLHVSHISRSFDPPLFNRFTKLCCNVRSVNSTHNIVHPLFLAPSAPVSFCGKASGFIQAVSGSNLP